MADGKFLTNLPLNIGWITIRKATDLCSTTTISLARGLAELGHNLTIFSPDEKTSHENKPWVHHQLYESKIRGFQASSIGRSAAYWFQNNTYEHLDVVLIDWQLAKNVVPLLSKIGLKMILIDRSPPADISIFGKLQWIGWRKGWKNVSNGNISRGCVVSEAHRRFVQERFGITNEKIHVLPAGVDLDLFSPINDLNFNGEVRLVYHGRLDKHRGVLALPILVQNLQSIMNCKLTMIGEGDVLKHLQKMKEDFTWLEIYPTLPQKELSKLLQTQHVGLLPMPKTKIWSLASPLKRSEYLASGLMVFGTMHDGHNLKTAEKSWYYLVEQENFHDAGVAWISELNKETITFGRLAARQYAEEMCSWKTAIDELNNAVYSSIRNS